MEVNATLSYIRIAPRKMELLVSAIRGRGINEALTYLQHSPRKKSARVLFTLLKSAVANADQKGTMDVDTLFVKNIMIGKAPTMKRWLPRAKGSASALMKRSSHIYVTLAEK